MEPEERIVYDWKHSGVQGVGVVHRPRPRPPPPPRWNSGPSPTHPFGPSPPTSPKRSVSVEVITLSDSPPHVVEYNHGTVPDLDKVMPENPDPERFLRNPFYKGKCEASHINENISNLSSSKVNTTLSSSSMLEAKIEDCLPMKGLTKDKVLYAKGILIPANKKSDTDCPSSEFPKTPAIRVENNAGVENGNIPVENHGKVGRKKRKLDDPLENLIGQKLNKARVGTSSRLYAKPTKKPVAVAQNAHPDVVMQETPKPDETENSSNVGASGYTEVRESENLNSSAKSDVLPIESTSEGTPLDNSLSSVENMVVDVSPYDILEIETELKMIFEEENAVDVNPCPSEPLPLEGNQENENVDETDYPLIKIRNDLWEVEDETESG